jgi:hypothetical protein
VYFYFEDLPSGRLGPDLVTSDAAFEQAKAFARAERRGADIGRVGNHPLTNRIRSRAGLEFGRPDTARLPCSFFALIPWIPQDDLHVYAVILIL